MNKLIFKSAYRDQSGGRSIAKSSCEAISNSQGYPVAKFQPAFRVKFPVLLILVISILSWSGCGNKTRPQSDIENSSTTKENSTPTGTTDNSTNTANSTTTDNPTTTESNELRTPRNKTPDNTPVSFKPGPQIIPGDDLVKYFETQGRTPEGKRIYFKIPVIFKMRSDFPGAIQEAFIGVSPDLDEDEKVRLDIDDSGMGIGLSDRLQNLCGEEKVCKGWLFGFWGLLLDIEIIPDLSKNTQPNGPPKYPFAMRDLRPLEGAANSNQEAQIWIQE